MAPQDSQPNQDPVEAARQRLAATYKAIAAQQGLTGQLGDSPNPDHWRTTMNTSATTQQAGGQQQSRTSALTFLPPSTPADYAQSSATRPAGGQASGQPRGNTTGQSQ
ncbi:hypothetical protein [Streptomyces niveus]|uniref:hypothetical protein n=1 Tax=Streptomyces niveus TaxID=193462 RepID=UPI00386D0253